MHLRRDTGRLRIKQEIPADTAGQVEESLDENRLRIPATGYEAIQA